MNNLNIGEIIYTANMPQRDAIHVAVVQVVCDEDEMEPGQKITFRANSQELVRIEEYQPIGVADPFLDSTIWRGDRFWMFLFPGTITGMTHHWQHPAFRVIEPAGIHEEWLREFAERWRFNYDELITMAGGQGGDRWVTAHGRDIHSYHEFEDREYDEFWYHLESLLGRSIPHSSREELSWSCSC